MKIKKLVKDGRMSSWQYHWEKVSILIVLCLSISTPLVYAENRRDGLQEIMDTLSENKAKIDNLRSGIRIEFNLVEEKYPSLTESELNDLIEMERSKKQLRYNGSDTLHERLNAIEFNIGQEYNSTLKQISTMTMTKKNTKWRLDHTIVEREINMEVPKSLVDNPYVKKSYLKFNKSRTYTWDGETHKVIFNTDDPLTRNGQISTEDRKLFFVEEISNFGRLHEAYLDKIKKGEYEIELASMNAQEITLSIYPKGNVSNHMDIVLSPEHNYSLLRLEKYRNGKSFGYVEYGDFRLIDGVWFPFKRIREVSREINGQTKTNKRNIWTVVSADFDAKIEDEQAVFNPPMPSNASVVDYRFSPPLTFRTDEGMHVPAAMLEALDAISESKDNPVITNELAGEEESNDAGLSEKKAINSVNYRNEMAQTRLGRHATNNIYIIIGIVGIIIVLTGIAIRLRRGRES
jgi:hypothetical protein